MAIAERQGQDKQKQIIVPIGREAGWIEARDLVREKGGLPSHVLHDDVLVHSNDWKSLSRSGYYGAWAREPLVHPRSHQNFVKGHIIDDIKDNSDRDWMLHESSVPWAEVLERQARGERLGLFFNPINVENEANRVVIYADPNMVEILSNFLQSSGWGIVDPRTRIPLAAETYDGVPDNKLRFLYRIDGQGVRPLARYYGDGRRAVYALRRQDGRLGVAGVELATEQSQAEPKQAVFARSVTPEIIAPLLRDANSSLVDLAQTVKADKLRPIERLIRALEIKE